MGCGKSTVARILASGSGGFFFDLDDTIELEEGRSISDIFCTGGQDAFRDLEYKYLERIISDYCDFDEHLLISLGGGTLTDRRCAALIKEHCRCIYLKASPEELVNNLLIVGIGNRPLLSDCLTKDNQIDSAVLLSKIRDLLGTRQKDYESCADSILNIDGLSPEQIAGKLRELL